MSMKTTIIIFLSGLFWMHLSGQTITNVVATQEENNAVITYDLECDGSADISLLYSEDDGSFFNGPITNVSGDIGYNITNGKNKRIVWNVLKGQDVFFGDKVVFRVMGFYKFGKFTDIRDGKTYRTVKIGNQVWMAENLNYKTGSSWCYNDNPSNCDTYGRLYNWKTSLQACPSGWHLPSDDEWTALSTFFGGLYLEFKYGQNYSKGGSEMKDDTKNLWVSPHKPATNTSGFSALPAGRKHWHQSFQDLSKEVTFWSSNRSKNDNVYDKAVTRTLYFDNEYVDKNERDLRDGLSVRCIKDN